MKQINKAQARKLYEARKPFTMTPCKCRVNGPFTFLMKPEWVDEYGNFDQMVNSFTYYNCNAETGRYPHFYVED